MGMVKIHHVPMVLRIRTASPQVVPGKTLRRPKLERLGPRMREANIKAALVVQARTLKQRSWEEDFRHRAVTKIGIELSIEFNDYILYVCTQLYRYIEKNQWGYNG